MWSSYVIFLIILTNIWKKKKCISTGRYSMLPSFRFHICFGYQNHNILIQIKMYINSVIFEKTCRIWIRFADVSVLREIAILTECGTYAEVVSGFSSEELLSRKFSDASTFPWSSKIQRMLIWKLKLLRTPTPVVSEENYTQRFAGEICPRPQVKLVKHNYTIHRNSILRVITIITEQIIIRTIYRVSRNYCAIPQK